MKKLLLMLSVLVLLAALPAFAQTSVGVSDQVDNQIPTGTQFLVGFGTSPFQTTETIAQRPLPYGDRYAPSGGFKIIGKLHVHMSASVQGAGATFQVILRTCTPSGTPLACTPVSRAVTCTIASGASDCSDNTDVFDVTVGDFIDWETVQTGTGASSSTYSVLFMVQ